MSRSYRILLLDDDEDYLSLVEKGAVGHPGQPIDWITASTEDEAKEKLLINKGDIDLILIDYKLRGSSGVEFIQSIRQEGNAVPSLLISHMDERNLFSDLAHRHTKVEVFSLHIIGFLQKPNNIIDGYPRFVESIIKCDRKNRTVLFDAAMQFVSNADSFLTDIKSDVAAMSRSLSMLSVYFRKHVTIRRNSKLEALISAVEEIESSLWELANRLSDAWRMLRDAAISGVKLTPKESSFFRPPDVALKLAREDKSRIRALLVDSQASTKKHPTFPRVERALQNNQDPELRTELLRDLVIGIAQIDDDFQTSTFIKARKSKQREHGDMLLNLENFLSEKGEQKLALIVKIIRLKHLKRFGQEKEFAFSLDSAFRSSLELSDGFLKSEMLSTLQNLFEHEPRQ